ncbi:GntR family transcriptional regulator [Streptomyces lunaelactis]|uniref:GntR family transcriptional regulator n=1 Tax=Streptomyces lunaelactis TaxID=1535768 RepID=A0A2R4TC29_9ACTN|nr:GntR family transcriptional regulator [Streptomyces lunaelactis]AVZ76657.1 GntR family transcriptional regulator [Streptomyces lunaelactis]NUK83178.1 GntR family transcriptional regulator [Streptomyces lunaelactis]
MESSSSGAVLKRERVREFLLGLIEAGRPGDAIPSERSLSAQLGVSRPTLRAAVDELVATGQLVREHGRGMFVAPAKITQELVADDATFAVPRAAGTWSSTVLELATIRAGARIGRKLRVSPAAELVYIARLRLVDGAPMAIEHLHIPAELVPSLTPHELEAGDLYDHLREHHQVYVDEAVQSIEPTVVNEAEAAVLDVPVLSPALLVERLTTDTAGHPVEYVHSVYRGDRYRIVSRLALGTSVPHPRPEGHHPGIPPGDFAHGDIITSSTTGDAY